MSVSAVYELAPFCSCLFEKTPVLIMAARRFIGSIDQGTTSTRFIIFDTLGAVICKHQVQFPQIRPRPGWEEHDPMDILVSVVDCVKHAMDDFTRQGFLKNQITSIGLTNQRGIVFLHSYNRNNLCLG
jgi:glycerol kinase